MLANDLLIDSFGRIQDVVHQTVKGLNNDGLTFQPNDEANSIAWLVWHLTRIQDDHIANLAGTEQIWTSGGWAARFKLPFDDTATGYGHNPSDIAAVRASAKQLLDYYDAVHKQTVKFIKGLKEKDYDRIVDKRWNPPVTLAVRLISVISDDFQHAGQAAYLRGLL